MVGQAKQGEQVSISGWSIAALCSLSILLASCGGADDAPAAEDAGATKQALGANDRVAVPGGWTGRAPKPEVINGISVPPEPPPALNNASVSGIDVNANGVRDDIERLVVTTYGKTPSLLSNAMSHARAQQSILKGDRKAYFDVVCGTSYSYGKDLDSVTERTVNTVARSAAYREFTDAPVSINVATGGCK